MNKNIDRIFKMNAVPYLKTRPLPKRLSGMKRADVDNDGRIWHVSVVTVLTVSEDYKRSGAWRCLLSPEEGRHHVVELVQGTNTGSSWIPLITEWVPEEWVLVVSPDGRPKYWAPKDTTWDPEKEEFVKASVVK